MIQGILGNISLIGSDGQAELDYVTVRQHWDGQGDKVNLEEVELEVTVFARSMTGLHGATLAIELGPHNFNGIDSLKWEVKDVLIGKGSTVQIKVSAKLKKPRLWWPNGLGGQHLYRVTATLKSSDGHPLTSRTTIIGLRSLEVVNQHDTIGASFFFRVNGVDVFAKGANWIPCEALPSRMTAERYEGFLGSAAKASMNMIRLWGGGMYEHDVFYDCCDRLGLLVYHDLPFSCSTYPSSKDFLDLVVPELRHQLRRLSSRPSIALWCGDNEGVGALTWFEETVANRSLYTTNYDRLSRRIQDIVSEEDPSRMFWPSSPCGGPSLTDVWRDNWHADGTGDMHFWSVWHESKPFEAYREINPRFCSEFGFQSFPSLDTIAKFCPPEERNPYAPLMEYHQKNQGGNGRIMSTMSLYFRFPEFGLASIVYLSQLQQAIAMKTAVEYWRTLRPTCMGAL